MNIIIQWVVWVVALLFFLEWLRGLRDHAKKNEPIHIIMVIQTILILLFLILFLFLPWNKLHLLWVIPMALLSSYISFIIFAIPIIGTLLRMVILLFAELFLAGYEGDIV